MLDVVTAPQDVRGASITLLQQCWRGADLLVEAKVRRSNCPGSEGPTHPQGPPRGNGSRGTKRPPGRAVGANQAARCHLPREINACPCCDIAQTDFSGIVYHANYLRFMERGRTNHLRLMGAEQQALFEQPATEDAGFAFVVRSMHLDFLKPARMDDVLDVVTWPIAVKGASIMMAQEVRRGEDVLVKAEVRVAFISGGRAQPIPKSIRALMKADLIS